VQKKFIRRAAASLLVIGVSALGLSACSSGSTTAQSVTLVTHDSFVWPKADKAQFEKSTGIKVKIVHAGDAGALTNKLVLTSAKPIGDAFYGIDNTFIGVAQKAGIIAGSAHEADFGDVCVNYDREWFNTSAHIMKPPTNWRDRIKPAYRGLTVVENPSTSSTGLAFVALTYAGQSASIHPVRERQFEAYWSALKANGVKIDAGWEDAYYTDFSGSSGKGAYPIVISYSTSPADEVRDYGASQTASLNDECFRQYEYVGALKGAANAAGATKVVEHLLGKDFQSTIAESMYVYPVNKDAALPASWLKYTAKAKVQLGADLNLSELHSSLLAGFNKAVGN
jgi:thiamine transport system substrate-binding protein